MDLRSVIESLETAEDFESRRGKIDSFADQFDSHIFGSVKTVEICLLLIDYFVARPDFHYLIGGGFTHYLREARVDYLRCFLPHINVKQLFAAQTEYSLLIALSEVVREGSMDVIELLFEHGLDVNTALIQDRTMLFGACSNKRIELIDLLISKGINVNHRCRFGNCALKLAIDSGEVQIVDRLILAGVDLFTPQQLEISPIEIAVWRGHVEIVDRLIQMRVPLSKDLFIGCFRQWITIEDKNDEQNQTIEKMIDLLEAAGCPQPTYSEIVESYEMHIKGRGYFL